jgi:drug/metabolite transporter (DMT)-like permease
MCVSISDGIMPQSKRSAYLKATVAVTAWGASFIATKVVLRDVSPVTVVWLRFAIGILILGYAVWARNQLSWPSMSDLVYFAVLGAIGITFHQWLQSTGLVTAEATTTAWIVASTPIFIALLGWMVLKEKLGKNAGVGLILATAGVTLVVTKGDLALLANGKFGTSGDLLILLSAPNWAVFSVLSRRGLQRHPAAMMMFYVMLFGWVFSGVQFFAGNGLQEIGLLTLNGWLGVGFLGIFSTGIAYIYWYDALQVLEATQTGVFLYLEPLVAIVVAALVLAEALVPAAIFGGICILSGVWLVNRQPDEPSID